MAICVPLKQAAVPKTSSKRVFRSTDLTAAKYPLAVASFASDRGGSHEQVDTYAHQQGGDDAELQGRSPQH